MVNFGLRAMTRNDLTLVWKWRNHSSIRAQSAVSTEISWLDHKSWFDIPQIKKWVFEEEGRVVGVCSLNHSHFWSFYLDPDAVANEGLGMLMLSALLHELKKEHCYKTLYAKVKKENLPSRKLHEKLGFVPVEKQDDIITLKLEIK